MKVLTRRQQIVKAAHEAMYRDETCEIDENAKISEGDDNGCYVQAWVWFDFAGTEFDKAQDMKVRKGKS